MNQTMFGVETEYALVARGRNGLRMDGHQLVARLMDFARQNLCHLRDRNADGMFLPNGGLFYIDSGCHPEFCTPECCDPKELVRYILAGELTLQRLSADFIAQNPDVQDILLWKTNVDYRNTTATWGCHESYLYKGDLNQLMEQVVPFLVSRIIFTGAGGFDPKSRRLAFSLSPRVSHLRAERSSSSTKGRGIFHVKEEPLCGHGYSRVHLICGESLCSETSMYLKTGTAALVLALIQHGWCPADAVRLSSPVQAMRTFARDETCTATADSNDGRRLTALEIQHHYLAVAEAHSRDTIMPAWAPEVIRCWRWILERIEEGAPQSVASTLDWAIKRELYRDQIRRRSGTSANREQSPALRAKLCEVDTRFGLLGEQGIFRALDRSGVLDHQVTGVADIEQAVHTPPSAGRARLRGKWTKLLAEHKCEVLCGWDGIRDYKNRRDLDLTHPLENEERWREWHTIRQGITPADIAHRRIRAASRAARGVDQPPAGVREEVRRRVSEMLERVGCSRPDAADPVPADRRPTPDGFREGDWVTIHRPANAEEVPHEEWIRQMDRCDGRLGRIERIISLEQAGRSLICVRCRGRQWTTRTCHLRPAGDLAATRLSREAVD